MSVTVLDLQTELAYRLGETSAPNDTGTKVQRLAWLNAGLLNIARRRDWWWQETSDSANTNTGSTTGYTEPTLCKKIIELKIGTTFYDEIPYKDNRVFTGKSAVVSLPQVNRSYKFYRFAGKYYLIPVDSADAVAHSIKFYKRVVKLVSDSDVIPFPDEYFEALPAYAEARYWMSITQQDKAAAPFQEFESVVGEMMVEQGRRKEGSSGFGIKDPDDSF